MIPGLWRLLQGGPGLERGGGGFHDDSWNGRSEEVIARAVCLCESSSILKGYQVELVIAVLSIVRSPMLFRRIVNADQAQA